jgi:Mg2+/Co2+ transporter CorB
MDVNYIIYLIILVLLSGFFSATETAFSSLNKTKLKTLIEKEDKKSKRAALTLKLVEKYDKLI